MILYYLFLQVFLTRETGTRQFLAIKALKKTYVLNRDMVAATFVEKRVLLSCENIPGVTTSNDYAGTVEYMAPEVWLPLPYILLLYL